MYTFTFSRNFPLYIAVFLLAPILGMLTAWNEHIGLFILGIAFGLVLVIFATQSVEKGLLFLFLSFLIVDPIRRLVGYQSASWSATYVWLLVIDGVWIITLFAFYAPSLVRQSGYLSAIWKMLPRHFKWVLSLFILWVILQMLNPYYPSVVLSLAAGREYFLGIPALGFGWFVVHHWKQQQWKRAYQIILISALGVIIISLIQIAIPSGQIGGIAGALLLPADTPEHSWEEGAVRLISSVFASSKRYGHFLLLTYPLLWAYLSAQKRQFQGIVFVLYVVGCFISGSREAIYLILIMEFLLKGVRGNIVILVLIFLGGSYAIPILTRIGVIEEYRLAFIAADSQDWGSRFGYMSLADLVNVNIPYLLTGIGPGRWGQPVQLLGLQYGDSLLGPIMYIGAIGDAGLFKVLVELGIVGLIIFLILKGIILYEAWSGRSRHRKDPYYLAARVAVFIWMILFLKRHTMLGDQMSVIFFWFYVGIIMAKNFSLRLNCRQDEKQKSDTTKR